MEPDYNCYFDGWIAGSCTVLADFGLLRKRVAAGVGNVIRLPGSSVSFSWGIVGGFGRSLGCFRVLSLACMGSFGWNGKTGKSGSTCCWSLKNYDCYFRSWLDHFLTGMKSKSLNYSCYVENYATFHGMSYCSRGPDLMETVEQVALESDWVNFSFNGRPVCWFLLRKGLQSEDFQTTANYFGKMMDLLHYCPDGCRMSCYASSDELAQIAGYFTVEHSSNLSNEADSGL